MENQKSYKGLWVGLLIIIIIIAGSFYLFKNQDEAASPAPDQNSEEPQDTEGITYDNASSDMIRVELPYPGAVTGKEFKVIGEARGPWYFEASFPVAIVDKDGNLLMQNFAQAKGEWMTTDFVPFEADMVVPQEYLGPATLILKKDNPSGLPENEASISFPIIVEY